MEEKGQVFKPFRSDKFLEKLQKLSDEFNIYIERGDLCNIQGKWYFQEIAFNETNKKYEFQWLS